MTTTTMMLLVPGDSNGDEINHASDCINFELVMKIYLSVLQTRQPELSFILLMPNAKLLNNMACVLMAIFMTCHCLCFRQLKKETHLNDD